jgi:hypothetical protein
MTSLPKATRQRADHGGCYDHQGLPMQPIIDFLLFVAVFVGTTTVAGAELTPAEARAIAREAYVYGFPLVDNYRIQHAYFIDRSNADYKAPSNQLVNIPRVYTPADNAVQTPNSDTPYSWAGLDLRTEPLVFTIPTIEKKRYWSVQLIDLYTHNFAYLGSRTTGNEGGSFLITGPSWQGDTPTGITKVIRCETDLALALFRTQLFAADDLENVKAIQAGYKLEPLSAFTGGPAPQPAPPIEFIAPLSPEEQKTSLRFFDELNFALQFCPEHPSEVDLRARFARLGIVPGKPFDTDALPPETRQAVHDGMADAWAELAALKTRVDKGEVTSGQVFGTREFLQNNYLFRMAAAVLGIYGNSQDEAIYPVCSVDAQGQRLDGGKARYTLRFPPDGLPPVHAFWSITLYRLPESLLYANPLDRYLINSPMLPSLKVDPDGGITIDVQHDSPGPDRESNWLPAPRGPFVIYMRLYWPKSEALDGRWRRPELVPTAVPPK